MTVRFPTPEEIAALDNALALEGVPANERHEQAMWRWAQVVEGYPLELADTARWFEEQFAKLHPSVSFAPKSFMYLCVSARGISYALDPPLVIGIAQPISPLRHVKIHPGELQRIGDHDLAALWEMVCQAADGIDLFMAGMSFHPKAEEAVKMLAVGCDTLSGFARGLVACAQDASLAQACCLAVESVLKAVLVAQGIAPTTLKKQFGHDIAALADELIERAPGQNDQELRVVAQSMPRYSDVRYRPPWTTISEAQDLYRRALFLCAEALRRTQGAGLYYHVREEPMAPRRQW